MKSVTHLEKWTKKELIALINDLSESANNLRAQKKELITNQEELKTRCLTLKSMYERTQIKVNTLNHTIVGLLEERKIIIEENKTSIFHSEIQKRINELFTCNILVCSNCGDIAKGTKSGLTLCPTCLKNTPWPWPDKENDEYSLAE